ncbi:hypothetical protein FDC61_04430 [Clostridium botulinum]|nr:hypothetical protein [Clostridium botulinum]NFO73215.1 hypothetical protein [Clostridium botulinum]
MNIQNIVYEELTKYLKDKNERIDKEYFRGVLKVSTEVLEGETLSYACNMYSQFFHDCSTEDGHLDRKYLRKYSKEIIKIVKDKIENGQYE